MMDNILYKDTLPSFNCEVNTKPEDGVEFHTPGHYPSDILDGDGLIVIRLCFRCMDKGVIVSRTIRRLDDKVGRIDYRTKRALPCVRCTEKLINFDPHASPEATWGGNQPMDGLSIETSYLAISACDRCIIKRFGEKALIRYES